MKKLIFAVLAALLAFALVTCDLENAIGGGDNDLPYKVTYDSTGTPRLVEFSLDGTNIARSADNRAMSNTIAKSSYNLFEVVFNGSTNIARAVWRDGTYTAITGVDRDEDYTGKAALFIGREENLQLLAVGVISHIDGVAVGATSEITANSKTVTFTVRSLEAGIHVNSLGNTYSNVSFTDGAVVLGAFKASVAIANTNLNTATATTVTYSIPFFGSPANAAALYSTIISATSNVEIIGRDPRFISGAAGANIPLNAKVQVASTVSLVTSAQTVSYVSATAGTALISSTGTITLNIYAFAQNTTIPLLTSLHFGSGIPVYALVNTDSKGILWYLSPGSETLNLDAGAFSSRGACMLLQVGGTDAANVPYNLTATSPAPDGPLYIIVN